MTASHELINTMTDPVFGTGIFDPAHNELASVCTKFLVKMEARGTTYWRRALWVSEQTDEAIAGEHGILARSAWVRGAVEPDAVLVNLKVRADAAVADGRPEAGA